MAEIREDLLDAAHHVLRLVLGRNAGQRELHARILPDLDSRRVPLENQRTPPNARLRDVTAHICGRLLLCRLKSKRQTTKNR